ncbi:UDP-N-acetylmuramate--L-alanine ligase [Ornithinimicrobium sp. Y1847]|uniref:UDP-N-acetylmuramate--L-alanine ligase n=1 Tax=unclassified Ornithinimicrobium TaxID=2615080 RepID=UPI003B672CD9
MNPRFDFTQEVPPVGELGAVHLIAIGGSGMSGVARMFLDAGVSVSGSDRDDSATLREVEGAGARVFVGHDAEHVRGADTVVISSAIPETNPELAAAREAGLRVLHRSQGIAAMLPGRDAVAIAGANGKTTTSAMTAHALRAAGVDPGFVIGAPLAGMATNATPGAPGSPVVVEADESDGSFLVYRPRVAVVTNVQPDHLDFYGDADTVERAYADFAATIRPGGLLVTNADDPGAARLAERARDLGVRVVTWGTEVADVLLTDLRSEGMGASAEVIFTRALGPVSEGTRLRLSVPVPGTHNVHNAVAALLVGVAGLELEPEGLLAGLVEFPGAHRRFELVGSAGGVEVVDDYAHNAPKVAAVVQAARSAAEGRRVIVAFQPHLFSRTRDFAPGFAAGLAAADVLLLLPVYGARETQDQFPEVSSRLIADLIGSGNPGDAGEPDAGALRGAGASPRKADPANGVGPEVYLAEDLASAPEQLAALVRPGDLVVTVGAGDVTKIGPRLLDLLQQREEAR